MPKDSNPSIKNEKQYEALRDEGVSKETSARIANSPGASHRGGKASSYEDMTRDELYGLAQEREIENRSSMTKDELIRALRNQRSSP